MVHSGLLCQATACHLRSSQPALTTHPAPHPPTCRSRPGSVSVPVLSKHSTSRWPASATAEGLDTKMSCVCGGTGGASAAEECLLSRNTHQTPQRLPVTAPALSSQPHMGPLPQTRCLPPHALTCRRATAMAVATVRQAGRAGGTAMVIRSMYLRMMKLRVGNQGEGGSDLRWEACLRRRHCWHDFQTLGCAPTKEPAAPVCSPLLQCPHPTPHHIFPLPQQALTPPWRRTRPGPPRPRCRRQSPAAA